MSETLETQPSPIEGTADLETTVQPSIESTPVVQDVTQTPPQVEDGQSKTYSENDFNALRVKVSSLEKGNQDYQYKLKELESKKTTYDLVEKVYAQSPAAYETFRQETLRLTGVDLGAYEDSTQSTTPMPQNQTQVVNPSRINNPIDVKSAVREVQAEEVRDQSALKFIKTHLPDLDPDKAMSEFELEQITEKFKPFAIMATTLKNLNPKMSWDDAFITSNNALNPQKAIQQAQKIGETIGRADALASGVGVSNGVSGSSVTSTISKTAGLTPERKAQYERLKIRNGDKFADNWLNKL